MSFHSLILSINDINSSVFKGVYGKSVESRLQSLSPFYIHCKLTKGIRDLCGKKLNGVSTLPWVIPCRCKTFSDVHGATECSLVLAVSPWPQSGDPKVRVQEWNHSVKVAEGKNGATEAGKKKKKKMHTVSSRLTDARQQPPTGANTLCVSLWEPPRCIVGVVSQQGDVSLPGRRDLTVRAKSPGMWSFEILMHCGSRGVLCWVYTQIHTPLIYGYTAAQQDPAFVGSEYTERVHAEQCVYVCTHKHTSWYTHSTQVYTHSHSQRE